MQQTTQTDLSHRLVAHRGFTTRYPENTLLALTEAIKAGAKYIEVDIQLTADHIPVLFHDRNLARLCRGTGAIHDYNYADLYRFHPLDFDRFGNQFADISIPRLIELVDLLKQHPHVTAFIELKRISLNQHGEQLMVDRVLSELEPVRSQCVIISYSISSLFCTRNSGWQQVGAVVDRWKDRNAKEIIDLVPEYLFFDHESIPVYSLWLGKLQFQQAKLAVFECVDPVRAKHLLKRGISLVETFNIGMMIHALSNQTQ